MLSVLPRQINCLVFASYKSTTRVPSFVVLFGRSRFAHPSESSPPPSPTEAAIEGLKLSLGLRRLNRYDGQIAAAVHLSPALGCQLGIHRILDSGVLQGIRGLDVLPRIRLVLSEIGFVIKVGLNLLCEHRSQHAQEN
jgi:hypothetical protein